MEFHEVERYPFRKDDTLDTNEKPNKETVVSEIEVFDLVNTKSWHGAPITPDIVNWEDHQVANKSGMSKLWTCVVGFGLLLFPLAYTALGIYIRILNGRSLTRQSINLGTLNVLHYSLNIDFTVDQAIKQVIKLSVTIWGIGFSVVVCHFLKSAASYKAEKGTRLITLEQLIGSRSVGSAFLSPLSFKRINVAMVLLAALWGISPVVSQALLRLYNVTEEHVLSTHDRPIHYLSTTTLPTLFFDAHLYYTTSYPADSLFSAALLSSETLSGNASVDLWQNPRIPMVPNNQQDNPEHWYDVDSYHQNPGGKNKGLTYSSLLGLPISSIPKHTLSYGALSQFTTTSGYFQLNCSRFQEKGYTETKKFMNAASLNGHTYWARACLDWNNCENYTPLWIKILRDDKYYIKRLWLAALSNQHDTGEIKDQKYEQTSCKVTPVTVQSQMECLGRSCRVVKFRKAPEIGNQSLPQVKDQHIPSFYEKSVEAWSRWFVDGLVQSTTAAKIGPNKFTNYRATTLLQNWLRNPKSPLKYEYGKYGDLSKVNPEVFNDRITRAFNTYYQASLAPNYWIESLPDGFTNEVEQDHGSKVSTTAANATVYQLRTVYRCNKYWLGVLLAACGVLIFLTVLGIYLELKLLGPDILGYVSSFTLHNEYMPLPAGGSLMDGMERTRKLGQVRVRLQDVRPDQPIGHVALSSVEGQPIQRGKLFR